MAQLTVRFDLSFGTRSLRCLFAAGMLFAVAPELASESVTLNTYYPAPSGVYAQMITTGNTYLARDGGTVGIGTGSSVPDSTLDDAGTFHAAGAAGGAGLYVDAHGNVEVGTTPQLNINNTLMTVAGTVQVQHAACTLKNYSFSGFTSCPGGTYATYVQGLNAATMLGSSVAAAATSGSGVMLCCNP